MPLPGQELASLDFESMLGGPLIAVVNAQAQAALSTVNFIKEVGFKKKEEDEFAGGNTSTNDPIYVTFKYPKEISSYEPAIAAVTADPTADPAVLAVTAVPEKLAVFQMQEIQVPILTMLPIPYIRIDLTTIDFNAKITSVQYRKVDTNLKIDAELV